MPKMDGFEATAVIREREAGSAVHTQIVALAASADKRFQERCLSAGMDEYIAKPFTRKQIAEILSVVAR
jgi:CheY-like chemotaxis protein